MSIQQPEALRLAEWLAHRNNIMLQDRQAAAELRRQHAALQHAHATIESLQDAVSRAQSQAARYANPRVIAQRYELLEALRYIEGVAMADEPRDLPTIVTTARDAIAKAEGREA